jgi:hypothetical protein
MNDAPTFIFPGNCVARLTHSMSVEILSVKIGVVASLIAVGRKRFSTCSWKDEMSFAQSMKRY